jgi:high-affinity Fe2+/Pb2+ permease
MAAGAVPGVVWLVLFVGAVLTVTFTFFFGTVNVRNQSVMTGALALLIFAVLLVAVAIDRPFAGQVRISPEALLQVREQFQGR